MLSLAKYSRKILIVDAHADSADVLKIMLEFARHHVHLSSNGRTALETVRRISPDIILADTTLPDLSGLDMCRLFAFSQHLKKR